MGNNSNKFHPKMDREQRAKQFMPFDALKGFREALEEKEKSVILRVESEGRTDVELNYKYDDFYL